MRHITYVLGLALASGLLMGGQAVAQPVQWAGNGHWYELVATDEDPTWTDVVAAAEAMGGYLATSTTAEENAFIASLFPDPPSGVYLPAATQISSSAKAAAIPSCKSLNAVAHAAPS